MNLLGDLAGLSTALFCISLAHGQTIERVSVATGGGQADGSSGGVGDGNLWGDNTWGQCNVPTSPQGLTFVEVAAGVYHTAARCSDGSIRCSGYNHFGQCTVPAPPAGESYVEIAAGVYHTVARRSDGSVVAWGWNLYGQCNVPALPAGLSFVEIAAGEYHTLGRLSHALREGCLDSVDR